jgi:hypothetical protein
VPRAPRRWPARPSAARTLNNLVISVAVPGSQRPEVGEARERLAGP